MKRKWMILAGILIVICLVQSQSSGDYTISQYTIDGGGGTSTGGLYTVVGTIAQPDASRSVGGDYELLGGFWPYEPLCVVDFIQFTRFAEYWLETGINLPGDLYVDANNIVDNLDLKVFVSEWLNDCPYDWSLK